MPPPLVLETTLRDGSYAINFQFTARDTSIIAGKLEEVGFDLIEIGHGIGLGASESGHGQACESDSSYMKAAAETLHKARWGMFCIPGIAKLEHIDLAAEYDMKFIRIGTDVSNVPISQPFIERAKEHGMFVCANYMKSYAASPLEFAKMASLSRQFGADIVYVVDSAGGMMPHEIEGYFSAVNDTCINCPIGFHGHDNLGLSVANALRAAELGASIIDTSLQGMGRSAGNTPTELFLVAMQRLGRPLGHDPIKVMDIGEKYIKPMYRREGLSSLDVTTGFALFHSSYMGVIREFSGKYGVDPRKLIIALCEKDKVEAPRGLVEELARKLSRTTDESFSARFRLDRYHGTEQNLGKD
tara:strand:- start:12 stop:1082 length:1071 start_codon:yes stop_codon:yes gene_type:complete